MATLGPRVKRTRGAVNPFNGTLTGLYPGEYHLSLYVEDARGNSAEQHVNITVQSSLPSLDRDSLVLSAETFTQDELSTLTVRIGVSDPDGTTDDVRVNNLGSAAMGGQFER